MSQRAFVTGALQMTRPAENKSAQGDMLKGNKPISPVRVNLKFKLSATRKLPGTHKGEVQKGCPLERRIS